LIYHRKKLKNQGLGKREILLFPEYYFMHNKIPNNNHVHRPHGFIEFQYLFPRDNGLHAITECLSICQKFSYEPLVCAVKMHSLDDYFISFSEDGYSFNIDIPLNRDSYSTDKFVDILLNLTKKYNAKLHLAKDERLTHKMFKTMYPRHKDFIKIKNKMDPHGLYSSDLYQRLFKLS
jgi:decaprenylphospho-beta-D-ribofuranose 2-oxidase